MREAFAAMPTFEWLLAGMDPLVFLHTEESSTLFFCTSLSKYIISRFTKTAAAATQQNLIRVDKNKPRVAAIHEYLLGLGRVLKNSGTRPVGSGF